MAHEILATDRIILARRPAWHGLGMVFPDGATLADARRECFDWEPILSDGVYGLVPKGPDGTRVYTDMGRVIARNDTCAPLGVVGPEYSIVANGQVLSLLDELHNLWGADETTPTLETAGTLRGGALCFASLRRSDVSLGGDHHARYAVALWGHDGRYSVRLFDSYVRVVCSNTYHAALGASGNAGIVIRHSGDAAEKVEQARRIVRASEGSLRKVAANVEQLMAHPWDAARIKSFWGELYERQTGRIPDRDDMSPSARRKREAAMDAFGSIEATWNREADAGTAGTGYTAYAALQAYTNWRERTRPVRGADDGARRAARMEQALCGSIAGDVQEAWALALAAD